MPVDGCHEHNFTLQSVIIDAKRKRKGCAIAWLDVRNAFGSVPHDTIFNTLRWTGLCENAIRRIETLYARSTTRVRTSAGFTEDIPIEAGAKQGCPLSPIIFNLALEPLIRRINGLGTGYGLEGSNVGLLAYADDLVLVSPRKEQLQRAMDAPAESASVAGLAFNIKKCATLHVVGTSLTAVKTKFTLANQPLMALSEDSIYQYESTVEDYINGEMQNGLKNGSGEIANIWPRIRSATARLRKRIDCIWRIDADYQVGVNLNGITIKTTEIERILQNAVREMYRQQLIKKPDQGKVLAVTSAIAPPNHFTALGNCMQFAEWRFILRTKLYCVPLNGTRTYGNNNK